MMHMKRMLIVSDDAHTRALMAQSVSGLELTVVECELNELRRMLLGGTVDLVLLDGGYQPDDAIQVVESVASEGSSTALLVLAGAETLESLRLPVGVASDFVVRGASATEIAARVRILLWPGEEVTSEELVRVGELLLNLATYQAYLDGSPIDFTYLEYALFAFLVTHPGRTYTREILLRRVWGTEYIGGSRTVDVHVRRVRAKIGPELSRRLETVRGVGYLWRT